MFFKGLYIKIFYCQFQSEYCHLISDRICEVQEFARYKENNRQPTTSQDPLINNNSSQTISMKDPSSRGKFLKHHLIFLLHANECNERDRVRIQEGEPLIPVSCQQ